MLIDWEKLIEPDVQMTSHYKMDLHCANSSVGASVIMIFLVLVTSERPFKRLNEPCGSCIQQPGQEE